MTQHVAPQPLPQALAETLCPLCGQPNACRPAATGSLAEPCWCREVTFAPELLVRVPEAERGVACICRRCATASAPHAPGAGGA